MSIILVRVKFAYLDESSTPGGEVYMFGALLVDEQQMLQIESDLDKQGRLAHEMDSRIPPDVEFHGYDIFHGKGAWGALSPPQLIRLCQNVAKIIAGSGAVYMVRGVDVPALQQRYGSNAFEPHELALGQALESIEKQMRKRFSDERVLIFADEHHTHEESRRTLRLARDRQVKGKISVTLDHVADTIYFGPSHQSRLLQAVDMATYFYQRKVFHRETDPRAQLAMEKIATKLNSITLRNYIWSP